MSQRRKQLSSYTR